MWFSLFDVEEYSNPFDMHSCILVFILQIVVNEARPFINDDHVSTFQLGVAFIVQEYGQHLPHGN